MEMLYSVVFDKVIKKICKTGFLKAQIRRNRKISMKHYMITNTELRKGYKFCKKRLLEKKLTTYKTIVSD